MTKDAITQAIECLKVAANDLTILYPETKKIDNYAYAAYEALKAYRENNGWLPIDTAPKDSGMFLVCLPRMMNLIIRARYDHVHDRWLTDLESQGISQIMFFHAGDKWQPLPKPPAEDKGE